MTYRPTLLAEKKQLATVFNAGVVQNGAKDY